MDIPGYEGLYTIDENGVIFGNKLKTQLKYGWTKKDVGYRKVQLTKNKIVKSFLVHRIVAKCFLPNPYDYPEVNHKDGDKSNNKKDNLEWCTKKQNMQHYVNELGVKPFSAERLDQCASNGKKYGGRNREETRILSQEDADKIRHRVFNLGEKQKSLAKEYNIHTSTINAIIKKRTYMVDSTFYDCSYDCEERS